MKISILMPVKNASPYLKECLDSILAQSQPNWELIAIDDHSTDRSFAILKEYAAHDGRIKFFQNNGSGIIPALRIALTESSGQFITRMDADDVMAEQKLAGLKYALLNHGRGHVAVGMVEYFKEGGIGQGYLAYQNWLNALTIASINYREIYKECSIPSPCWMVYHGDLLKAKAFDSDTYPEDYDLAFRFKRANLKVIGVSQVLHHWRDHESRSSRTSSNYADNRFLELKLQYFLADDYQPDKRLALWGAGKKGKWIAQALAQRNILFSWITDNPKKIGVIIGDTKLESSSALTMQNHQIIVAVANADEQCQILNQIARIAPMANAFLFC